MTVSDAAVAPEARIAFLGGGNMATSLIGGLVQAGHAPAAIRVFEPNDERAAELRRRHGVQTAASAADAIAAADCVVLATKPQQVADALAGLQIDARTTVISICAGVRIDTLRQLLGSAGGGDWPGAVVRAMPNTPALFGAGITGVHVSATDAAPARALAVTVLGAAGALVWVEREALMDAVTAVSGSGPAYFFLLTEAMAEAGVALGLPADDARRLALQTFIGAARMAEASGTDVATLRAQVTSPGGTTQAALQALEAAGFRRMLDAALAAAEARGAALGQELAAGLR